MDILTLFIAINFIIDIRNVPKDQQYLALSLRLEEKRFYNWGDHAGLIVDDPEMNAKEATEAALKLFGEGQRGLTFDILAQIQILFENFRKKQLHHKRLEDAGPAKDMPMEAFGSKDEVLSNQRKHFLKKAWTRVATKSTGGWNRLRWVNFDKAEVKELILQFTALNDKVTGLFDSKIQKQIAITTQDTYREVLQLATRVDQFQQIIGATAFGQQLHGSQGKKMKTLMSLAQFKFFHHYIEKNEQVDEHNLETMAAGGAKITRQQMRIPVDLIQVKAEQNAERSYRSLGIYPLSSSYTRAGTAIKGDTVWVEWKNYDTGGAIQMAPTSLIMDRVEKLSNLLNRPDKPTEFRVPRCLGYFDNRDYLKVHPRLPNEPRDIVPGKIGFIFAPPEGVDMRALPRSLLDLLQPDTGVPVPTITARIALANALASSLMFLHTVDWLHKGLRSDNVLFFKPPSTEDAVRNIQMLKLEDSEQDEVINYENPILSGFDYARPASRGEYTEAPDHEVEAKMYRHPESQKVLGRPSYCKTFDIYSLGVILVEIAFWMPIEEVVAKYDRVQYKKEHPNWNENDPDQAPKVGAIFSKEYARGRPKQTMDIRSKLLMKHTLQGIGSQMGVVYQKVVAGCLNGGSYLGLGPDEDEAKPSVGVRLGNMYYEKVVRELDGVKI